MGTNQLQPRSLVFEDNGPLRDTLTMYLERIGFEVVSYPDPYDSSFCSVSQCPCQANQTCADVIITDIRMPAGNGLNFVHRLLRKGCRIKNVMVMSGDFSESEYNHSVSSGFFTITKPFTLSDIRDWLNNCKNSIDPNRELSTWFLK